MINKLLIAILLLTNGAYFLSINQQDTPVEFVELKMVSTDDLIDNLLKSVNDNQSFAFNNETYNLVHGGKQEDVPVYSIGDDDNVEASLHGEHDFYFDLEKSAIFTVSNHYDHEGQLKRSLRANILDENGEEELVVEPVHSNEHPLQYKRDLSSKSSASLSKIYKRSVANLPFNSDYVKLAKRSPSKRQTGQGPVNNFVEILVVADFAMYERFRRENPTQTNAQIATNIEAYLSQVVNLGNLYYQRSFADNPNLKITLVPVAFVVLTTSTASAVTTQAPNLMNHNGASADADGRIYVNGETGVDSFNKWLVMQRNSRAIPTTYDSAVLFSFTNLVAPGSDILGIAPLGGTCFHGMNGYLVEDNNAFTSARTFAHELAHNLGIEHDPDYSCSDAANFVMSTSLKSNNRLNSFVFSKCSTDQMVLQIRTNNKLTCLANQVSNNADFVKYASLFPGQLMNATEQCRRLFGSNYFPMFGSSSMGQFESLMCQSLYCTNDGRSATQRFFAAERTSCGNGRWCVRGECVADAQAPRGDCLINDDTQFCTSEATRIGRQNVCVNYQTGRCCRFCNPNAVVIPRLNAHEVRDWITPKTINNQRLLTVAAGANNDAHFCPNNIYAWLQTHRDACTSPTMNINGAPIRDQCRNICTTISIV